MGEWSEFFEDFPEYAPTPPSAEEIAQEKFKNKIRSINADAFALIEKVKKDEAATLEKEKQQYLKSVEDCPQCGEKQLNIYKLKPSQFLCECQECGTYGTGADISIATQEIENAFGDDLDWRNSSLFKLLLPKAIPVARGL